MSAALPKCRHPVTGRSKVTYRSRAKAERAAVKLAGGKLPQFRGCRFHSYCCWHCGGWHISSQEQR
jgi:hypothetical protein